MNHPLEIDGLVHEPSCFVFRAPALTVARPLCSCGALISDLASKLSSAEKRVEEMEKALAFYANPWGYKDQYGDPVRVPDFYDEMEFGDRARSALHIPRGRDWKDSDSRKIHGDVMFSISTFNSSDFQLEREENAILV